MAGSITTLPRSQNLDAGGTYRVAIDVPKIQANVFAHEGGRLTELAVRNWLRSVGFTPEAGDRPTWLADRDSLGRLDGSEILSVELLREAFEDEPANP